MNSIRLSLFVFLYLFLLIIPPFYIDKLLSNYFYFDNGIYQIFMMLFYGFYGYFVVLLLFKKLINLRFDSEAKLFVAAERQLLLKIVLDYYTIHLDGFKKPKSLDVLAAVFS